jgi:hypothetical protein
MPRPARDVPLTVFLALIVACCPLSATDLLAQERAQEQIHVVLQLEPLQGSASFVGGVIDMQFSGIERDWHSGSGTVELSFSSESPPGSISFLGGLSWSTADADLPVPPTEVTFSMFAADGSPYRVMVTMTPETEFTMLPDPATSTTIMVHGTIHLHVSLGSILAVDEAVRVRGHAVFAESGMPR